MNIVLLDNDECLGYFGTLNGLYTILVGHFRNMDWKLGDRRRLSLESIFADMSIDLLDLGFARPGLKEFFRTILQLKESGSLNSVIMYTSAARSSPGVENYMDWISMLHHIFETYEQSDADVGIYDYIHSGRSDEDPPLISHDGATLKNVGLVIQKLGIQNPIENVNYIAFYDDRPNNLVCLIEKGCPEDKFNPIQVKPYYYLPSREEYNRVISQYAAQFERHGIPDFLKKAQNEYNMDFAMFSRKGYPIGTQTIDNDLVAKRDRLVR